LLGERVEESAEAAFIVLGIEVPILRQVADGDLEDLARFGRDLGQVLRVGRVLGAQRRESEGLELPEERLGDLRRSIPCPSAGSANPGCAVIVLAGSSFCGWVCPFGALQDALTWLRRTLHIPEVKVPARADRILRYGRFVTLGLILFMTVSTVKLWFAAFDPYRTLFGLEWLVDFNLAELWPAYLVVVLVVAGSLLIQRFWCRYLCPLGGLMSLLGHVSFLRIRRNADSCQGCALCNVPCPVGIDVANASKAVSTNCIGCLACVQACPRGGTLEVQLAPTWLDPLNRPAPLVQPAVEQAGQ
jgi:NAD-dependent dihydropyrimidine dehydrogenase PreA subunit